MNAGVVHDQSRRALLLVALAVPLIALMDAGLKLLSPHAPTLLALPDGVTWIGAAIIVASGLYLLRRERIRMVRPGQASPEVESTRP